MIPDYRYWQHVKNCADLYQKTYGTKTVEEMNANYEVYKELLVDLADRSGKPLEEVSRDVSDEWEKKYQTERVKRK